jgi:hypothetical protein
MSEPRDQEPAPSQAERDSLEDDAMKDLLRRSLGPESLDTGAPDLLRGVQKKIRVRSKGKFFSDGWSTSQPRVSYVLVALIMVLLVAVAYFVLGPTGFH